MFSSSTLKHSSLYVAKKISEEIKLYYAPKGYTENFQQF